MKFLNGINLPSILASILKTNGSGETVAATANTDYLSSVQAAEVSGRLTLTSGLPVTTSDVSSAATLYFTPFNGNTIALWNTATSTWEVQSFTEQSISVSGLTASTLYDVFASNNNGTFTLTATAWTNVSTRATALVLQNGVYCLTGSLGKRYLGSIYVGSGSVTFDAIGARWVWNKYNRIQRKLESGDTNNASYTLVGGAGTWQYCRNIAGTSQCSFVIGQVNEPAWISISNYASIPGGGVFVGTGVNVSFNAPTAAVVTLSNGFRIGGTTGGIQSGGFVNNNYLSTGPGLILLTQLEYAEGGTLTYFPGASTSGISERSAITALVWG